MYLTLCIDEDEARGTAKLDRYLESYYNAPAAALKKRQACYAGPASGAGELIAAYLGAGVQHLVLRFAGDHGAQLEIVARLRATSKW